MNYHFAAAAEIDLAEAMHWYEKQNEGLGKKLLAEVETTLQRICDHPLLHTRVSGEFRKALLDRFPYKILYRITSDTIEVAAVFHMRRHPSTWQGRMT